MLRFPSLTLIGATGAGKSCQIPTLISLGVPVVVACYDTGSTNSYRPYRGKLDMADTSLSVTELIKRHTARKDGAILVVDHWYGYELDCVKRFRTAKRIPEDKPLNRGQWGIVTQPWLNELLSLAENDNVILVSNISDGTMVISTADGQEVLPPGSLVCSPHLRRKQAYTAMFPCVIGLTRGSTKFPRGFVTPHAGKIGECGVKFVRPDGGFLLPGQSDSKQAVVDFDSCCLADVVSALAEPEPADKQPVKKGKSNEDRS